MDVARTEVAASDIPSTDDLVDGRDELTLAEFPISVLPQQRPYRENGKDELEFVSERYDRELKRRVTTKLRIASPRAYGLPKPKDEQLLLALISASKHFDDFKSPQFPIVAWRLIGLMGWSKNTRSVDDIEAGLDRLTAVTLKYTNSYWDPRKRTFKKSRMTGILAGYDLQRGRGATSYVQWHPDFHQTLCDGAIRKIDLNEVFSFRDPLSQRMFRYLQKTFYKRPYLEMGLQEFAQGNLGMIMPRTTKRLKERINDKLRKMEERGLVDPTRRRERFVKKDNRWRIRIWPGPDTPNQYTSESKQIHPVATSNDDEIVSVLERHGVDTNKASELAESFSSSFIREKIEYLEWKISSKQPPVSPAGWVVEAIRKDWKPPAGFESSEQRAKRESKVAKRKQAAIQQEAARKRADQERIEEENRPVKEFLDSLSQEQLDDLFQEALEFDSGYYRGQWIRRYSKQPESKFSQACKNNLVKNYVKHLLAKDTNEATTTHSA